MREQEIQPEGTPLKQIPAEETTGKILVLKKTSAAADSALKAGGEICGMLTNGPIGVGKPVRLTLGHTREVLAIAKIAGGYRITTGGGEYFFDPREAAII